MDKVVNPIIYIQPFAAFALFCLGARHVADPIGPSHDGLHMEYS